MTESIKIKLGILLKLGGIMWNNVEICIKM